MDETAYDRLRGALARHGSRIEDKGPSDFMAQCPAHEDHNPSLSVSQGDKGVKLWCHAGCTEEGPGPVVNALRLPMAALFDKPIERKRGRGGKTMIATYDYVDEQGHLLFQACRYEPKSFSQRRPDPSDPSGWSWKTAGVRRVLYRLPQIIDAVGAGRRVFLVEGEKDVHALEGLGEVATTAAMGAGNFGLADVSALQGADVVAVVDNDSDGGQKWAPKVRDKLDGVARSARFVQAATGKDAADHIAAGHGVDDFVPLDHPAPIAATVDPDDSQEHDTPTAEPEEPAEKKSAATLLVEIALELYDFGTADTGEAFAIPKRGPKVVGMLRGGKTSLRSLLAREYFTRHGKVASQQALTDAIGVVEGFAIDAPEQRLYMRVAEHDGNLWLDLGDDTGKAVKITTEGWQTSEPPVRFKRTTLNGPLPDPQPGGDLTALWQWLNVTADDRPLVLAWLASAFLPDIPHPVLGLFGEQGTGKTTAEKLLVSLIDPGPVPVRQPPRDKESWVTAAAGSWLVGIDNLSHVPEWLSDTICRAATGDGDVRRKLYTDGDYSVFAFRRCVILNGIDLGALAGDLGERMLPIELQRIREERRREETDMWPQWSQVHPKLLGALLDLVAGVKAALPFVELESRPRMADFARVLAAVDKVTGTNGLACYLGKQSSMATDSLTGDAFVTAIGHKIGEGKTFTGTAAEIHALVTPDDPDWRAPKGWPASARTVTQRLKRQGPTMRKAGWIVENDGGRNRSKSVKWTITAPAQEKGPKVPPQHPQDPSPQVNGGKDAGQENPSTPALDPRLTRVPPQHPRNPHDSGPATREDGYAGVAGQEYGPSLSAESIRGSESVESLESRHTPLSAQHSTAHMWWPRENRGEHGRDCTGCRRSTGGPDHTNSKETTR